MNNPPRPSLIPMYDPNRQALPAPPSAEVGATIESLRAAWGPGALWDQAEVLTAVGAAPHWIERWNTLWAVLKANYMDDKNQDFRLRKAAELAADMAGSPSPEKAEEYESLRLKCCPPEAFADNRQDLWVACTNCGLILLLGQSDDMFRLLEDQAPYALPQIPSGRFVVLRVEGAMEISRTQAPYWAWAAAKRGLLYGVDTIPAKAV